MSRRSFSPARLWAALLLMAVSVPAAAEPAVPPTRAAASAVPGTRAVVVAPLAVGRGLDAVGEGLAAWVRLRLSGAGVATRSGADARRALRGATRSDVGAILDAAGKLGSMTAIAVELRAEAGSLVALMSVYDVESGRLAGFGRGVAPVANLSMATRSALRGVLRSVGSGTGSVGHEPPFALGQLAAASRAIARLDRGAYASAWRELEGDESPLASDLREQIEQAAASPTAPVPERARLLAAMGRGDEGWRLIARDAAEHASADHADPALLLATGEVLLERGQADEALAVLERAKAGAPRDPEVLNALARAVALGEDRAGAASAYRAAARLDPSPDPLLRLAQIEPDPSRKAVFLMHAGRRSAERLAPEDAETHYARAVKLDPRLAGPASELRGELRAQLGEHDGALSSYRASIAEGGSTPARQRGLADAERALGNTTAAARAYQLALSEDPEDAEALRGLGELYLETERGSDAVPLLERAVELAPESGPARRSLARAHRSQGDDKKAFELLRAAEKLEPSSEGLREIAAIARERGSPDVARKALEQARRIEPTSLEIRRELALVYEESGDPEAARLELGATELLAAGNGELASEGEGAPRESSKSFDSLVGSFGAPRDGMQRVVLLGVGERRVGWKQQALAWLSPRTADARALESELRGALAGLYVLSAAAPTGYLEPLAEDLLDFGDDASLAASSIASVNLGLETDAIFAAQIVRDDLGVCSAQRPIEIELRRLAGQTEHGARVLANSACLPADGRTTWNARAGGTYAALLFLLVFPMLRGFGNVIVTVKIPPKTRALFSIGVSSRPKKVQQTKTVDSAKARARFERRLRQRSWRERPLRQGRDMVFRWLSARRRPYYVTLRGPLIHFVSDELIGDFLEEQAVRVQRGKDTCVDFDLRPRECAVEVGVYRGADPVPQAMVGRRGQPDSIRYAQEGTTFIYLKPGEHVITVGANGCVAERPIRIDSLEPQPLAVDLVQESGLLFSGCPEAVGPYMEGNFSAAADALERAGAGNVVHVIRARWFKELGRIEEAASELTAAGMLSEAAELRAKDADLEDSANLFSQAGEHERAAEAYRRVGNLERAAESYEQAYDYPNAIECYRALGDTEKLLTLLEASGEFYEAGKLALEVGQTDRGIHDLQQVEGRHREYSEVCRTLARVLADRGDVDFALEKLDEARELAGAEGFPIELQEEYGKLLERAGRIEDALAAYAEVRRRDINYGDVGTRIDTLKRQVSELGSRQATAPPQTRPAAVESRYELIAELGRGGMGVVYKARDKHLGRIVALKQLTDNLKSHPKAIEFFEREARSAAALNHQNIVTLYDAGQENGVYFMTMEFLEGTPLDALLTRHRKFPARVVAKLGGQVATGLHYAHKSRIIHRDIKTANLFLTRDKVLKIMDFGLAKMVEEVRRTSTVIGGTPYYMAPEQAEGGAVDHRADLYALGVTFFQLATGSVPFTEGDVTYHHRHSPAPDPRELDAEIPATLAELIVQLMAKDPADRIQEAGEVAARLEALARG